MESDSEVKLDFCVRVKVSWFGPGKTVQWVKVLIAQA